MSPSSRRPAPRPVRRRPAPRGVLPARLGRRRVRVVGVLFAVVLSLFMGRLVQLQVLDPSAYARVSAAAVQTSVLPATRGDITSADGTLLATTVTAYDVIGDPKLLSAGQNAVHDAPAQAAQLLSPILGVSQATLRRKLGADPESQYTLLAKKISPQAWQQIKDLRATLLKQAPVSSKPAKTALDGITVVEDSKRVYPDGGLASNVVGYVNSAGKGAGGLEYQLDSELAGKNGHQRVAQVGGQNVPSTDDEQTSAVPGTDVRLTLDSDIQAVAQKAITQRAKQVKAQSGYVVVMDTRTQHILAMASTPGFDPNDLASAKKGTLGNPALQDAFEPGSVAKLMTISAVLDQNVASPSTRLTVPGSLYRAGVAFHDDTPHGTEHLTLTGVLAESSNIGTIMAEEKLGKDQRQSDKVLYKYLRAFGIGQKQLGFPGETAGILPPPAQWNATQQFTIPFGQGISINALQEASAYSTIANGGVRVPPSLVLGSTGPDGRYVPAPKKHATRVVSTRTAKQMAHMLEAVTTSEFGTGTMARIPGYLVAGKTGTANRVDPKTGRYSGYTASFSGFAPADKPRVEVTCIMQDPTVGHFGGETCGPVFKKVMEFALKTMQVPPTGKKVKQLPVLW